MITTEAAVARLEQLLNEHGYLTSKAKYDDLSDLNEGHVLANRLQEAIERIAPPGSSYVGRIERFRGNPIAFMKELVAVAIALREDLKAGWLKSVVELVHADMYADFLEMAEGLLDNGYKDPAAVIAGTSLEVHLRSLCSKYGVAIDVGGKPKKADTMNSDLKKSGAYSALEQKNITAWLHLRNSAAHGNFSDYDAKDVAHLISGVRNFMSKYSA